MVSLDCIAAALLPACGSERGKDASPPSYQASIRSQQQNACDKVLDSDIFDRVGSGQGDILNELLIGRFFAMSEDDAHALYGNAVVQTRTGTRGSRQLPIYSPRIDLLKQAFQRRTSSRSTGPLRALLRSLSIFGFSPIL